MSALSRWQEQLAAWRIPDPILAAAEDSPWVLPRALFVRRADEPAAPGASPSDRLAGEALDPPGTVLDVGAAAGAASLPLAGRATGFVAVDTDRDLLAAYAERAAATGVPYDTVVARWPDGAAPVPVADVVVCGHVFYNAPDLDAFAAALTAHARRRVVVELADRHPLTTLNALWREFHGVERPTGPSADDAVAVLREAGVDPQVVRWERPARAEYPSFAEMVDVTRRRLCLPRTAARDVAAALRRRGVDPAAPPDLGSSVRAAVTLAWAGTATCS